MLLTDLLRGGLDELATLDARADAEAEAAGLQQAGLARLRSFAAAAPAAAEAELAEEESGGYICHVSGGVRFASLDELKAHCRSDWYRYNLKRRAKSQPPAGEDQFEALVEAGGDLDEISGSDESDDDDEEAAAAARADKQPVATFRHRLSGLLVSAWRCVLAPIPPDADAPPSQLAALRTSAQRLLGGAHLLVLLSRGGHFAAIVVKLTPLSNAPKLDANGLCSKPGSQLTVLAHKTLHRYVTRRKAGGRQATADGAKAIKSVGSSLRRHNEAMLTQEIRECLVPR
ncbi:hypothetical protein T492DRAFT_902319 [Pavlovales sp. CCMP2436]|nr:hypothetical protein T492DRAFT_902319 [Pavlovales sp. CCMP2436]